MSNDSNEFIFDDITPVEIEVKIGDETYLLVEASGEAGSAYRDAKMAAVRAEVGDGDKTRALTFGGVNRSELVLLSQCLYKVREDGKGSLIRSQVPISQLKNWPDRISQKLVNKVKEISELSDKEDEGKESGNSQGRDEQGNTMDGSDSPLT